MDGAYDAEELSVGRSGAGVTASREENIMSTPNCRYKGGSHIESWNLMRCTRRGNTLYDDILIPGLEEYCRAKLERVCTAAVSEVEARCKDLVLRCDGWTPPVASHSKAPSILSTVSSRIGVMPTSSSLGVFVPSPKKPILDPSVPKNYRFVTVSSMFLVIISFMEDSLTLFLEGEPTR